MRETISTPVGEIVLDASERGLRACSTWKKRELGPDDSRAAKRHLEQAREALGEYFRGRRSSFEELSLAPDGTPFQLAVWAGLRKIRHGTAWSYAELARRIGRPGAFRAVGGANAKNPIGIIQPCHRVVGSNGALVGFAGGLPMKAWLLRHEGVI